MHQLTIVALCGLVAAIVAQAPGFSTGSSFQADEQTRLSLSLQLVSRAGCQCASASNAAGNWNGCGGSVGGSGSGSGGAGGGGGGSGGFGVTVPSIPTVSGSIPTVSGFTPTIPTIPSVSGFTPTIPSISTVSGSIPTISGDISGVTPPSISIGGEGSGHGSGDASGSFSGSFSGSGECETSGEYAETHGGWFEGDYCLLLQIFISWCDQLSEEDSITFRAFIDELQQEIILDGSLTDSERFVLIVERLQLFLQVNVSINEVIQWEFIQSGSFSWGYTAQLNGCALDVIADNSSTTISLEQVITVEGGSCPLTQAATQWAGSNAAQQAAVATFNAEVITIAESSESEEIKYAALYSVFGNFSANFPSFAVSFFNQSISGFAPIGTFSGYCTRSWGVQNFGLAVGGPPAQTPLLVAIEGIISDTSFSVSYRSQVKQWYQSIEAEFNETTDVTERITYVANITYQFFLLDSWNVSTIFNLNISGFGSFEQLIDGYIAFANGQISIPVPATTVAATSPTTPVPTPTTIAPASCSAKYEVQSFSSNSTLLIQSIQSAQASWSQSYINQFRGYLIKLYKIASNTSFTQDSVFQQSKTVLVNFTTQGSTLWNMVQSVQIQTWGGKVSAYCGCA